MICLKLTLLYLLLPTIPGGAEVLTQSLIIRLSEMSQVIENQKRIIEETSLKSIVEEQQGIIDNLISVIEAQKQVIGGQKEMLENQTRKMNDVTERVNSVIVSLEHGGKQPSECQHRMIEC